jgi:hypothetical protein
MALLQKKAPALSPVEQARADASGAVQAFIDAKAALEGANNVLLDEVRTNEELIVALQQENEVLTAEATRNASIAAKIGSILE